MQYGSNLDWEDDGLGNDTTGDVLLLFEGIFFGLIFVWFVIPFWFLYQILSWGIKKCQNQPKN